MIVEFILTFDFWQTNNASLLEDIEVWSMKYYIGLQVVDGKDPGQLLIYFSPKVMILFFVMNLMQNEIALGLFD